MKRFQFPLQPIRVLREQRERAAQQRYADALRLCEDAAFQLQRASDELASSWESFCDELAAGVSASKLHQTRAWCDVLEIRQKQQDAALKAARVAMNAAWRELMTATRDREALDRYHDKCLRAHEREVQREEQKQLDELGLRLTLNGGGLRGLQRPGGK